MLTSNRLEELAEDYRPQRSTDIGCPSNLLFSQGWCKGSHIQHDYLNRPHLPNPKPIRGDPKNQFIHDSVPSIIISLIPCSDELGAMHVRDQYSPAVGKIIESFPSVQHFPSISATPASRGIQVPLLPISKLQPRSYLPGFYVSGTISFKGVQNAPPHISPLSNPCTISPAASPPNLTEEQAKEVLICLRLMPLGLMRLAK